MYYTTISRWVLPVISLLLLCSCEKGFQQDNFTAYIGGEITNPTSPYILFCKDSKVIDTIIINKDNTFFKKFDSLAPGMYTFRNDPEYQYVYFDKNDSLMVRVNAADFDESVVFCGRGAEKNNFLMDLYLRNERDRKNVYATYEADFLQFNRSIDSTHQLKEKLYHSKKEQLKWSEGFDEYAAALLNFNYLAKKEIYPIVHKIRTGTDIRKSIPRDYYNFRKEINFDNAKLSNFSPFVKYLTYMLDNMALEEVFTKGTDAEIALDMNIRKMQIADSIFTNEKIKNTIIDNIAFTYLLEDQNIINNRKFFESYHKVSTDKSQHNEIVQMGNSLQLLSAGKQLPEVVLRNKEGDTISSSELLNNKAVIFFWTENLESHLVAAHTKILDIKKRHPEYTFIAVNVDRNHTDWRKTLSSYRFGDIQQYQVVNFEDVKNKWAIYKIHRTILTHPGGEIDNAFVSIFDANFEKGLK